ncbi:hypothetical protein GCM10009530_39850 [Microbispora corallina]|uniref:Uncharacterized protein n=1 Tax=Microbispora corallina TaxID=83302 RepID=A0ABQ4G904_9ACTN|nr:DUF4259 domain-containing protein [Microbispora corallina]GIH43458.1 hypothetical protein Mco01_64580 [Microbispora corallina]
MPWTLRPAMVRGAFTAVVDNGGDYLDSDLAVEAIAAAAIVASQLPGGTAITSSYAPDSLLGATASKYQTTFQPWRSERWTGSSATIQNGVKRWEETGEDWPALAALRQIRTTIDAALDNR